MNKLTTRTTLLGASLITLIGTLTGCNTMTVQRASVGIQYSSPPPIRQIIITNGRRLSSDVILPSRPVQIIPRRIYREYIY